MCTCIGWWLVSRAAWPPRSRGRSEPTLTRNLCQTSADVLYCNSVKLKAKCYSVKLNYLTFDYFLFTKLRVSLLFITLTFKSTFEDFFLSTKIRRFANTYSSFRKTEGLSYPQLHDRTSEKVKSTCQNAKKK